MERFADRRHRASFTKCDLLVLRSRNLHQALDSWMPHSFDVALEKHLYQTKTWGTSGRTESTGRTSVYTTDVKVADGASAAVRKVKLARTLMRCTALSKRPRSAAVDRRAEGAAGSAALEAAERIFPHFSVMVQVARFP
jgi:hypothetical protein